MKSETLILAKEHLHRVSAEEIEAHNLIAKTKHGYICPFCGNGSGKDGTGMEPKIGRNGQEFLCGKCGDTHDVIDIVANRYDLDPVKDFPKVIETACDIFGISIDGENVYSNRQPLKAPFDNDTPDPRYLERIKRDIKRAHENLTTFLDAQPNNQYRGLNALTLHDFRCGYLSDLYLRKNAPLSKRFIVPYSFEHYLARLVDTVEDYDVPDGVRFSAKEHTATHKTIFNFKRALADSSDPVCFIVEGEFDCMSVAQVGRKKINGKRVYSVNVIAIAGSNLSDDMAHQLKSLPQKKFLVMLDNDDAGKKSAPILVAKLQALGHSAAQVELSDNFNDANDFLCSDPEAFQARIEELREDADNFFSVTKPVEEKIPPATNPPTEIPAPCVDKYDLLFEGLKPINISAGAILNVAKPDVKPPLEILFVEKNFVDFVYKVTSAKKSAANENPAIVHETPFGDTNIYAEQVRDALKWLVDKLFPFFGGDNSALKKFLWHRLKAAKADGAIKILSDKNFLLEIFSNAQKNTADNFFHFDDKIRRELTNFAKHSTEIFNSLLRFDYARLEDFLPRTFTDVVCAELLVDIQKNFFRFDVDQATWYVWNKNHWQAVNIKSKSALYDLWTPLARKIRVFAEFAKFKALCERDDFRICHVIKKNSPEEEKFKRLEQAVKSAHAKFQEANKLEDSRAVERFLEQSSGLPEIKIRTEQLDTKKFLFNCDNCTINLETMETFDARQEDLITLATATVYDPNASCDDWNNFLQTAIPSEQLRDWLQRFLGYCLSGSTAEDIFVFIHGIGGSGKTTLLNAIGGVLGKYAKIFPVDMITENNKARDGNEPNPMLACLRSCRFARSSETKKNHRLAEDVIKRLAGKDPLVARELNKPPFEFTPNFKIAIDGNFLLNINDINDNSIRRRIRIVPLNNPPPPDKLDTALESKLSTPQCRSAILNWLLVGWQKYRERGLRDTPDAMKNAMEEFCAANDYISDFLESHSYSIGDKHSGKFQAPVTAVWRTYNEWQRKTPRTPSLSRSDFTNAILQSLRDDDVEIKTIHKQKYFVGFAIDMTGNATPPPEY